MAKASNKNMGSGTQGKGDGSGAMTELPPGVLEDNMVLSNRDKSRHNDERGLDSRQIQTEQFRDHVGARRNFDEQEPGEEQADGQDEGGATGGPGEVGGDEK